MHQCYQPTQSNMAYSSFFKPVKLLEYFARETTVEEIEIMSNYGELQVNGDDEVLVAAADENQNQNTPAENGETQTPSTTSTMTSSVTEARLRQLERENMHLREQVNKHSRGKSGRVIRQIGKKPREGGQDTLNHGVILPKVEEIFYDEKFWTNNWEIYNTEENSICTRVMSVVSVPMGMSPDLYYQDTVVPKIVNKWKNLKTNFYEKARVWWTGKYCVSMNCYHRIRFSPMSGNYQSTEQLRAGNWIINEIVSMVMHPVKGLFPTMMKPVSDDDNEDAIVEYDWTFLPTAVKMLYIVLHNVTRYLYTQVSDHAFSNSLC